eukprot:TRINITY_DN2267_c0_g1_i2.p2 TRINITY_DN2267_c0_g1~~TRINITY_DN2267_c0_g1_i2.p2  ORF type:complete len:111 (-),score=31.87 TRINITY_DN2267_c0_g1_i2:181-513(-)
MFLQKNFFTVSSVALPPITRYALGECPNKCSGNGDCNEKTLVCDCDYGFSGDDCDTKTFRVQYALAFSFGGFILIIILIGVIWEGKKKFVNFLDQMRHMKQLHSQPDLND